MEVRVLIDDATCINAMIRSIARPKGFWKDLGATNGPNGYEQRGKDRSLHSLSKYAIEVSSCNALCVREYFFFTEIKRNRER